MPQTYVEQLPSILGYRHGFWVIILPTSGGPGTDSQRPEVRVLDSGSWTFTVTI